MKLTNIKKTSFWSTMVGLLATSMLWSSITQADFLAGDPGTMVSVQLNNSGFVLIRPEVGPFARESRGGPWTHPVCQDLSAAALVKTQFGENIVGPVIFEKLYDLFVQAANSGALVNINVDATRCHAQGFPLIRSAKITPVTLFGQQK